MKPIIYLLDNNTCLMDSILNTKCLQEGVLETRTFPDGEYYFRNHSDVAGRTVWLMCSLDNPNAKLTKLIFVSSLLKEQGASFVGLISPYLSYMRQDKIFKPGELITAKVFAGVVSQHLDHLITIDPHLHRILNLNDVYSIPTHTLFSADVISEWIKANVGNPLIVGPDSESEQWVEKVASKIGCQSQVLTKIRRGDYDVAVSGVASFKNELTPVIVDDIISSGRTMIELVKQLRELGYKPAICVTTHALFDDKVEKALLEAGAEKVVSTNTIFHSTNSIDVTSILMPHLA